MKSKITKPIDSDRLVLHCWKCHGPLQDETAIDARSGLAIRNFLCLDCGRLWPSGERSRPAIAA